MAKKKSKGLDPDFSGEALEASVSAVIPVGARAYLDHLATLERRSVGFILREAVAALYRQSEQEDPPWTTR